MFLCRTCARTIPKLGGRWIATTTIRYTEQSGVGGDDTSQAGVGGEQNEAELKEKVLNSALQFVPLYGWTETSIAKGAEFVGLPSTAHGMFPGGGVDLVHFFVVECNNKLISEMDRRTKQLGTQTVTETGEVKIKRPPSIRLFVRDSLEYRLKMIIPYSKNWPEAMALLSLPQNAQESWKNLANLCDEIWYYAGDESIDMNWYSKRVTLAMAYKSTELCLIQDTTENFEKTWKFLDRRIEDLSYIGFTLRNLQQMFTDLGESILGAIQVTRNMIGMNNRVR